METAMDVYHWLGSTEAELLLWGLLVRGMGLIYLIVMWGIWDQVRAAEQQPACRRGNWASSHPGLGVPPAPCTDPGPRWQQRNLPHSASFETGQTCALGPSLAMLQSGTACRR